LIAIARGFQCIEVCLIWILYARVVRVQSFIGRWLKTVMPSSDGLNPTQHGWKLVYVFKTNTVLYLSRKILGCYSEVHVSNRYICLSGKFWLKLIYGLRSVVWQKVVQKLQLWRLLTSSCVFSSTPELLFGLYLVYFFRVFERQIGSNKYLVWFNLLILHPFTLDI